MSLSSVSPAESHVELFLGCPTFEDSKGRVCHTFWDHFLKGDWFGTPSAGVSYMHDSAELVVQAGQSTQYLQTTSLNLLSTSNYPFVAVGVTEVSDNFSVQIQLPNDSWVTVLNESSPGHYAVDLRDYHAGDFKNINFVCGSSPGETAVLDYLVICKEVVNPDAAKDVVDITVGDALLNDRVSSAVVSISNLEELADSFAAMKDFGFGIIWVSRDRNVLTDLESKLFGGRISSINQEFPQYGEAYINVNLYGHASELTAAPKLVHKLYTNEGGKKIIEDTLDLCSYLTRFPHGVGWFDEGGYFGDTDDRIDSVHSVEHDDVLPLQVAQEILEKAHNPAGIVGFDMQQLPSGVLVGHLRYSMDWLFEDEVELQSATRIIDFHRVTNRQTVFGASGKRVPEDESWSESIDGWVVDKGSLHALEVYEHQNVPIRLPKAGNYLLWAEYDDRKVRFRRDISDVWVIFGKRRHTSLEFWRFRFPNTLVFGAIKAHVELWAPDINNKFYADLKIGTIAAKWRHFDLPLGVDATEDPEDESPGAIWKTEGNPDWDEVTWLCFDVEDRSAPDGLGIDDIRLVGSPHSATFQDGESVGKYGVRVGEPIIDQALLSNDECLAVAKAEVEKGKKPPITVEPFVVDGMPGLFAGLIMTDGVNNFRIVEVTHSISGSTWDAEITVSEVP